MRIVIDMQGAQTESRYRGIGRYTLSFAQAVVRNRGEHEVFLALSGLFPDTIEPIRAAFHDFLPQENIRVWHAPGPVKEEHLDNRTRREMAELIREAFLASLNADIIHICSLFEGYVDDAVTSIGRFDKNTLVSVTLHDLIPLLSPDQYLTPNPNYAAHYHCKLDSLKQAALYLAISKSSQKEIIDCLAVDEAIIVNTYEGVEGNFRVLHHHEITESLLTDKLSINRPFVLYTGGADERKNLPRLIEAWSVLSTPLRQSHQLLFAGRMPEGNVAEFRRVARSHGLQNDELLFSGYVSDEELVQLYNLCKLYVFPSWHEGFGLPALEAMACGAPVIGANTTSLPEVIGLEDALFDPFDVVAISRKIVEALQDDGFRSRLREHGVQQSHKHSWDTTAQRAVTAWEVLLSSKTSRPLYVPPAGRRPKLAFVSPLPPERTGIADYSAELLPALSAHYDIDLVVAQNRGDAPWGDGRFRVRDVDWFRANAKNVDRVLYQMGNSPFHQHMLPLVEEIPGTVVLHDFYISGLMAWQEQQDANANAWISALYESHGYHAVCERHRDAEGTKRKYPVNWHVLQNAEGIIVHSEYSRILARQWYGEDAARAWKVIPLLRSPAGAVDKKVARKKLGIDEDSFVICSFGFVDATKLNHRLLQAWFESALATDKRCQLIFVGENHGGEYGVGLLKTIREKRLGERVRITGFASTELFMNYLAAADLAVQLRTQSRGETSAAALDCMNNGLPLIVNANGSMAELDPETVWMLPDDFADNALIEALETLWRDPKRMQSLGRNASSVIHDHHAPEKCARQYAAAIEHFHRCATTSTPALINTVVGQINFNPDKSELIRISSDIAATLPLPQPAKRLFLDVTATCRNDLKTGIERVARALMLALLESPPEGYRIEPVYLSDTGGDWHHRHARSYTLKLLGCPTGFLVDDPILPTNRDILIALDLSGEILVRAEKIGLFRKYRQQGVSIYATVFDLLPILLPETFPPGADQQHQQWLQAISTFDGAVCISETVSIELHKWQNTNNFKWENRRPFSIDWFHLGADVTNSAPTLGLPENAETTLQKLKACPSFLMVGTIEPRKGYRQTLDAFTHLWQQGQEVNLVIVGHEGWRGLPDGLRRDIPETVALLRSHSELNKRLFWLEGISDEYLEKVYAASTCLIAASYGEGFGLPLIEAAQHKLPIIARDIPVFREVASEYAYYFGNASTSEELGKTISEWLTLYQQRKQPQSNDMPWVTWEQSAKSLIQTILMENSVYKN